MRHAMSFVSLTLLLLLVTRVHGIRLLMQEEEHMDTSTHNKIHEESLKGGGGSEFVEEDSCRNDGHCSGRSRKLITQTMTTSKSERSSNKATTVDGAPRSGHDSKEVADPNREDLRSATPASRPSATTSSYPDILDIAGMDYSPAKRKPPIHN